MKEKIPFYEIATMFFTGAAFSLVMTFLLYDKISFEKMKDFLSLSENWTAIISIVLLVAMFEIGFILNKSSAVLLNKLLKKIWPHEEYSIKVSQLEEENKKFKNLNRELHVIKSHILMYIILSITAFCIKKWILGIAFVVVAFIFLFAGRRTNYFMNIIKKDYNSNNKKDN